MFLIQNYTTSIIPSFLSTIRIFDTWFWVIVSTEYLIYVAYEACKINSVAVWLTKVTEKLGVKLLFGNNTIIKLVYKGIKKNVNVKRPVQELY